MTKRADYALLALSHLARSAAEDPGRLANTKEISEQYDIPLELLAKILQILAKNGLVASHPGPTGGYRLLRGPSEISVAEVVILIDGPVSILHCSNGQESNCRQFSRCTIRDPLVEIESRVKNLLDNISIEEISGPVEAPKPRDFTTRAFAASVPMAQVN